MISVFVSFSWSMNHGGSGYGDTFFRVYRLDLPTVKDWMPQQIKEKGGYNSVVIISIVRLEE